MRVLPFLSLLFLVSGCGTATLHRVAVDEIDASRGHLVPFEVHASTLGVNVQRAGEVASTISRNPEPRRASELIALTQMGPKTGNPVFDARFADGLAQAILDTCPSGRVTGLMSLRESRNFDAVSDEGVTIRGFCIVD